MDSIAALFRAYYEHVSKESTRIWRPSRNGGVRAGTREVESLISTAMEALNDRHWDELPVGRQVEADRGVTTPGPSQTLMGS